MSKNDPMIWSDSIGLSKVKCGCGFYAESPDAEEVRIMFDDHPCPNDPPAPRKHWLGYVFSYWTFMIVLAASFLAAVVYNHR